MRRGGRWLLPSAAALTLCAVPHVAVAPQELAGAAAAAVALEARVRLHVLRQVVLHLEALGAHRAVERPQVQVHVDVAVAHAAVRERLAAVAHEQLAAAAAQPPRPGVHGVGGQPAQVHRPVLQVVLEGDAPGVVQRGGGGGAAAAAAAGGGGAVQQDGVALHVQGEELAPPRGGGGGGGGEGRLRPQQGGEAAGRAPGQAPGLVEVLGQGVLHEAALQAQEVLRGLAVVRLQGGRAEGEGGGRGVRVTPPWGTTHF